MSINNKAKNFSFFYFRLQNECENNILQRHGILERRRPDGTFIISSKVFK